MSTSHTFKQTIGIAFAKAAILMSLATVVLVLAQTHHDTTPATGDGTVMGIRPNATGSPAEVLARMGDKCWTGAAPARMAGKMPGHVVVRFQEDGPGAAVVVRGSAIVGKALDQTFNGKDWHLDVFAYCD